MMKTQKSVIEIFLAESTTVYIFCSVNPLGELLGRRYWFPADSGRRRLVAASFYTAAWWAIPISDVIDAK